MGRGKDISSRETQLIDYYTIDELVDGLKRGYTKRVQNKLAESHQVQLKDCVIRSRIKRVINKAVILSPAAEFNGVPGPRSGKDQNYAGLWTLADLIEPNLQNRDYLGLAGNQILAIRGHVGGKITVCEKKAAIAEKMSGLVNILGDDRITVENQEIFRFMNQCNPIYNILDLDLMCNLPRPEKLDKWVVSIKHCLRPGKVVMGMTTCVGRGLTEIEYQERVVYFRNILRKAGLTETGFSAFSYRDRRIPMRVQRYVLTKE